MTDQPKIIGRRIGETNEITVETIRATGLAMGLSEAQIAKAIEALVEAQEEE
jgi:hypothetical protein